MADGRLVAWLLVAMVSPALAQDEAPPDDDFIEYLGMWDETDEEWLLYEDLVAAEKEKRSDPAPEGEASTENSDEG